MAEGTCLAHARKNVALEPAGGKQTSRTAASRCDAIGKNHREEAGPENAIIGHLLSHQDSARPAELRASIGRPKGAGEANLR
jgi:hypothetical protein